LNGQAPQQKISSDTRVSSILRPERNIAAGLAVLPVGKGSSLAGKVFLLIGRGCPKGDLPGTAGKIDWASGGYFEKRNIEQGNEAVGDL